MNDRWINKWIEKWINGSPTLSIVFTLLRGNYILCQPCNELKNWWMDEWMDGWMDR